MLGVALEEQADGFAAGVANWDGPVAIGVCDISAAWDVALNFIERWNHHIADLQLEGYDPIAPVPLLPQTACRGARHPHMPGASIHIKHR